MQIFDCIDKVGSKYGYDSELIDALKRCIPAMAEGKTEEDVKLLMDTLERVQIYTFDKQPNQEQIDAIISNKVNGRNDHVRTVSYDKGEYGKGNPQGSYVYEDVFDDDMNVVDRVGIVYLTNLHSNSQTAKFYGTKINLSHLMHELGHAWGAQKDELQQEENGDYTKMIGAAKYHYKVDRKAHTVEETGIDGLYIEEALNSIEEEDALYRLFGIDNFRKIPGYVSSNYQGNITNMMRDYIEQLGKSTFEGVRIQKDRKEIEKLQEVFDETNFMKSMQETEYYTNKGEQLNCAQNTSMSDEDKKKVKDFFEKYRDLYLTPHSNQGFLEHLDRVMEQLYNFTSIKYSYDIFKDDIKQACIQTQGAILEEGYAPIDEVAKIMEERKSQKGQQVTLSGLAREALEEGIRSGEVTDSVRNEEKSKEGRKTKDEPSI